MSMDVGTGKDEVEVMAEINTTPLIDVMLVLLIMLIITIPIQTHAVKLALPVTTSAPVTVPPIVRLEIAGDGSLRLNGAVILDTATLETQLRALAVDPAMPQVQVQPDRAVKYGHVARVMAAAQRAGLTRVGIVGNEVYAE